MAAATTIVLSSPPRELSTHGNKLWVDSPSPQDLPSLAAVYATLPIPHRLESANSPSPEACAPGFVLASSMLDPTPTSTRPSSPPGSTRLGLAQRIKSPYWPVSDQRAQSRNKHDGGLAKHGTTQRKSVHTTTANKSVEPAAANQGPSLVGATTEKHGASKSKQSRIKNAKVFKPGIDDPEKRPTTQPRKTKTRKKPGKGATFSELLAETTQAGEGAESHQEATKRRRDWTPVKDARKRARAVACLTPDSSKNEIADTAASHTIDFQNAFDMFGFRISSDARTALTDEGACNHASVTTKHRLDFVDSGNGFLKTNEKAKRSTSPAKKPQTITDKATAPFANASNRVEAVAPLHRYFESQADKENAVSSHAKGKLRCNTRSAKSKKAQKQPQHVSLLSPISAMKRVQDQELIFGTCSQLARDESPTFLQDYQRAIEASEADIVVIDSPYSMVAEQSTSRLSLAPTRSLWSAGSRGLQEDLLASEPITRKSRKFPVSEGGEQAENLASHEMDHGLNDTFQDIDLLHRHPQPLNTGGCTKSSKQANTIAMENTPPRADNLLADPVEETQKLDYNGFTDAQLRKAIAAFGFKPVKKRTDMISLLERCQKSQLDIQAREGATPAAKIPVETSRQDSLAKPSRSPVKGRRKRQQGVMAATDQAAQPRRPRGRPKKVSDDQSSDPKPKKAPKQPKGTETGKAETPSTGKHTTSSSRAICHAVEDVRNRNVSNHEIEIPLDGSPLALRLSEAHHDRLLKAIGKAITRQPATHDMRTLSWHEKIMMYDPIVIEELTVWLNQKGLAEIDEDDEVDVFLVKEWCESQSICCLWKENLKGGKKSRW